MAFTLRDRIAGLAGHRLALLAVLVLALGTAVAGWRAMSGPAVGAYRAERGTIVQTVVASGTTFLLVTHNACLANRCDRIVELVDGRIVSDRRSHSS